LRGATAAACIVVAVLLAGPASAAAGDCPYPLGDFIARGDFHAYPTGSDDPAFQIVDAVRVRPQYSFGQMGYDGDTLHFAYESETDYLPPNSTVDSETHIIAYKEYSHETGWNVTRQWISSNDPAVKVPPGRHVQPTLAVGSTGTVMVAWQVSGHTIGGEWWPQFGNFILYRTRAGGAWGPIEPLSPMDNGTSHRLPKSVPLGEGAYVAYQTNVGEPESTAFRIVGRTVSASGLGPLEDISVAADGFSDETVQLVTDGARVVAVWSARNTTEFGGEGEWRVWAAQRGADGTWSTPVAVSERSKNADINPSSGFYGGEVYAAWSTNDPGVSPGGDRSIAMRKVDLVTGAVGGVVHVTDAGSAGYDDQPALIEWDGDLQVLWASASSHNQTGVLVNDTDIHWRAWDGSALSDVKLVSPPDDGTFKEFNPAFLVVDDALHATFIMDVNTPATGKLHDQRQMTRVLFPGDRASARFSAAYEPIQRVSSDATQVQARLYFQRENGPGVPPTDHFGLVLADGSWVAVSSASEPTVTLPVVDGQVQAPRNATWCGKLIPIEGRPGPAGDTLEGGLLWVALVLAIVAAVGVAAFLLRRQGHQRRGSE
jgi:hypothetical protein